MVEDQDIKTKVSPFAIREGEIKVFDGKDGYVSMNQIIEKINIGHISEVHFKIMELINEFEFMTSRQIYQLLDKEKYEIKSQDKLNNKLEQLVKSKILTRYYFNAEEGKGIYRIYRILGNVKKWLFSVWFKPVPAQSKHGSAKRYQNQSILWQPYPAESGMLFRMPSPAYKDGFRLMPDKYQHTP